jgi:hypothetical protein
VLPGREIVRVLAEETGVDWRHAEEALV